MGNTEAKISGRAANVHQKLRSSATSSRKKTTRPNQDDDFTSNEVASDILEKALAEVISPVKAATRGYVSPVNRNDSLAETKVAVKIKKSPVETKTASLMQENIAKDKTANLESDTKRSANVGSFDMARVRARMQERAKKMPEAPKKISAKEVKEREIRRAINLIDKTSEPDKKARKIQQKPHSNFGIKRIIFATACTAMAVFAIFWLVKTKTPDAALRVAAIQNGIEASYPSYVPRDYTLSNIVSEEGKIKLEFNNSATGSAFTIEEETSSWDSTALLNNYVRKKLGSDYVVIKEQGLTLYIGEGQAAWVNGGIFYKLSVSSGTLTKKQIKTIAVSL